MKKFLLLLFIGVFSVSFAQTTVTYAAHNPMTGNTVNNVVVNGTPDNSATGSGVTFSNAALTSGAAANTVFATPSTTEVTSYPGSNLKSTDASGAITYYKSSATKLEITGAVTSGATLNFTTDNATAMVYPTSYGSTNNDTAAGTFTYSGNNGTFSGTIVNSADASGTLVIGPNTYPNVLRVKSVQNFSLFVVIFVPVNIGTMTNTIYTYYDNIERYPMLTTTTGNITVPSYSINQDTNSAVALSKTFLGVENVDLKKSLFVFPNPVEDEIHISGDLSDFTTAEIYAIDGRFVKSFILKSERLNISELKTGNYILTLKGKTEEKISLRILKK